MQELVDLGVMKITVVCLVAFLFSLPIIISRGFRGLLIMLGALTVSASVQEKFQNIKYASLSFFCIVLLLCLFIRPER